MDDLKVTQEKFWAVYTLRGNIVFEQDTRVGGVIFLANQANYEKQRSQTCDCISRDELCIKARSIIESENPISSDEAQEIAGKRIRIIVTSLLQNLRKQNSDVRIELKSTFVSPSGMFIDLNFNDPQYVVVTSEMAEKSLRLARFSVDEPVVQEVLHYLYLMKKPFELMSLYKVCELIKQECIDAKLASKNDIERFTASSDRKKVTGAYARHGKTRNGNPLGVDKARDSNWCIDFMLKLTNQWIEYKLKEQNP